jgi:hypothetical protein
VASLLDSFKQHSSIEEQYDMNSKMFVSKPPSELHSREMVLPHEMLLENLARKTWNYQPSDIQIDD